METMTQMKPIISTGASMQTVVRELPADLETPVSVYLKLAGKGPSFLLESVSGGEQLARYSFIGVDPAGAYVIRGSNIEKHTFCCSDRVVENIILPDGQDPWETVKSEFAAYNSQPQPGLPRFTGGLVGYIGYEMMRYFEPKTELSEHPLFPDAVFLLADIIVAFDHAFGRMLLIGNASADQGDRPSREEVNYRLDQIEDRLSAPIPEFPDQKGSFTSDKSVANRSRDDFESAVEIAKEHIAAGEIFQVVLSQRYDKKTSAYPFEIYRSLRRLNPSPYMFYFDFNDIAGDQPLRLIGASPEVHARLEGRLAAVRPIAGTRNRGSTPAEELALENELLGDPKERAEHVMLVDLARNDLGRICEYGTVKLKEQMVVERYSHVLHIVSHVEGELKPEYNAFDLLKSTFPAGTVSGAPKIRAMQIIDDLEPDPRGPYAGAVGYFSFDGSMDTCIAIRTIVQRGDTISFQAGAGIVADSVPEFEYKETIKKLRALVASVETVENQELTA